MRTYIKAGRLVDCTGADAIRSPVVLVEDGRIIQVGTSQTLEIPVGSEVIDCGEGTLLPGLIDSHLHIGEDCRREEPVGLQHKQPDALRAIRGVVSLYEDLMSGVTTARALGDGTGFVDVILRDAIERGEAVGPRLLVAAQALRPSHGTSPEAAVVADGVDEVRRCVRQAIFHGADVIKLFISNISRGSSHIDYLKGDLTQVSAYSKEELVAAVEEARRSGVKVCGHCIGGDVVRWALEAGFASLEHANLIEEEDIPLFLKTGAYISDPNLILFFDPVRGFETPTNKTHKWEDLPEWWHEKVRRSREQTRRVMSKALKAGVKFALGTDLNHTLLWLECKYFIEEIGATNMQALFAVTRDSAELLGLADEIGTLEEGKCADIICVDGNPLEDISALSRVQMVMRSGHVVKDTLAYDCFLLGTL